MSNLLVEPKPPPMRGWNLALRFGLEIVAFWAFGFGAWTLVSGGWRWVASLVSVAVVITAWGTFNVLDDPSRSGRAPVEVPGLVRIGLEALIFVGAAALLVIAGRPEIGSWLGGLTALHYAVSWKRLQWLVGLDR